jgi:hypothetical protein
MAYFDSNSWSGSPAGRQGPWDPAGPPSRPGTTPQHFHHDLSVDAGIAAGTTQAGPQPEEGDAFYYQFSSKDHHQRNQHLEPGC